MSKSGCDDFKWWKEIVRFREIESKGMRLQNNNNNNKITGCIRNKCEMNY